MNYSLKELLDIPTLRELLDSLDGINRMPSAIIDTEGNILTATDWQDICTGFHRVNPETGRRCLESDRYIEGWLDKGMHHVIYHCPMGLMDAAAPIIIEGKHLGSVFVGQFFISPPDEAYFTGQARRYGFNESQYLDAMRKVPLFTEELVHKNLNFIGDLVQMLAEQGLHSRRQLETVTSLKESEQRLKVIFDKSEAGIMVVSPESTITFANKRMAAMFRMTLPELTGSCYLGHLHESEKKSGFERIGKINKGEIKAVELNRHYVRKDGTDFWGHLTGTRFENADGSMRDQIIVISDITERILADKEKRSLEKQLQQAQKLESLGVLAGGIAHDFNNILAIIIGHCGMAKMRPNSAADRIPEIEKAAERAAELCRQMLAYAGKAQVVFNQVDMALLVDDMVRMLRATTSQNAVILSEQSTALPFITGDASQIRQIVMNLIINASEAIGESQGEIHVNLATCAITTENFAVDYLENIISAGCYVCLEVTDNGCGMDEETRHRIFEPFFTTKFTGRGLGMSATLGIIKAHKGALQLMSRPGIGTTFKVYLPVQKTVRSAAETDQHESSESWQGSGTVLMVEDEAPLRMLVKMMLNQLGFTVIEAADGKEALSLYRGNIHQVTLVMTDIGMPVMDGYLLIHELKKNNPELPIVISSGFGDPVVSSRIASSDIAGMVSKPYSFNQLQSVLKKVMEESLTKQMARERLRLELSKEYRRGLNLEPLMADG